MCEEFFKLCEKHGVEWKAASNWDGSIIVQLKRGKKSWAIRITDQDGVAEAALLRGLDYILNGEDGN